MTILGKFFTVLVFVMSSVFMAFAVMVFVTHKNWRDYATSTDVNRPGLEQKLQQQIGLVEQLQRELQQSLNSLAAEQAARRYAISVLQTKMTQLDRSLTESEQKLSALLATHGVDSQSLNSNTNRLTALTEQVEKLRAENRDAQLARDEEFLRVVALTDELNQANGTKIRLEERGKQLAGQVTQLTHILKVNGIAMDYPPKNEPPKLYGRVKAVKGDLIEISIGMDDGLKEGHELDIYRDTKYVGRVIIRKVTPDASVGQIIPKFMQDRVREQDNVTTKFG